MCIIFARIANNKVNLTVGMPEKKHRLTDKIVELNSLPIPDHDVIGN